jgi:hypothetical protein
MAVAYDPNNEQRVTNNENENPEKSKNAVARGSFALCDAGCFCESR